MMAGGGYQIKFAIKILRLTWAVVVAQLVERLLPKPEIRGLNPVISKIFTLYCIKI